MAWRDQFEKAKSLVEDRTGIAVVPGDRLALLEQRSTEAGYLRRELDSLAWTALNYGEHRPQDLKPEERLKLVQKARVVWMKDPQAGAACDLLNDFVFGSGIPKPKANDPLVQDVIDDAWDDPDNQDALTAFDKQLELGIDLELQANLFFLVFDDGEDGKVKLAVLDHDTVIGVVRDPEYRRRVLYYRCNEPEVQADEWDYVTDQPKFLTPGQQPVDQRRTNVPYGTNIVYYEHWRNVERAVEDAEEGLRDSVPDAPPANKLGDGKVFHVAVNKLGEQVFGHPRFDRLIGWYNAYNRFMDARVDIMEASAAFVMKKKVKGTPSQLRKQATQALSKRSSLGLSVDPLTGDERQIGPKPASILAENDSVEYEDFNIKTNSSEAASDAQMIRAQISAATRFPQSYYGDATNSNLATATSLELPVLKGVESRQEIFERVVRWFVDRAIERAVDAGVISTDLSPEERAELEAKKNPERQSGEPPQPGEPPPALGYNGAPPLAMQQAHDGAIQDEVDTERDLGYEFKMPNPLKRLLPDLVTAIANIAKTFDPNNTNMELSRTLLGIALGEALEMEDPAGAVEKIFPEGYVDPAVAAAQAQQAQMDAQMQAGQQPFGEFGPGGAQGEFGPGSNGQSGFAGADGQRHQAGNAYGAPAKAAMPGQQKMQQSWPRDRFGEQLDGEVLEEMRLRGVTAKTRAAAAARRRTVGMDFDAAVTRALEGEQGNGNDNGGGV